VALTDDPRGAARQAVTAAAVSSAVRSALIAAAAVTPDAAACMTPAVTSAALPATHAPAAVVSPVASARTWCPMPKGCYEWIYVISGRFRLVLGDTNFTLTAGEAAEFDTRIPHAVVNGGRGPAELLNIFGPQGERVHLRARGTAPKESTAGR
jgi:mannose-6-phosphate isomerase-like protein (cupin superfamily)